MSTTQQTSDRPDVDFSEPSHTPVLLICGAFKPEIAPLLDLDNSIVHVAGASPHRVVLHETGIGGLNAALFLERFVRECRPAEVLFLGSCGEYTFSCETPPLILPDLIFAREFLSRDLASLEGKSRALLSTGALVESRAGLSGEWLHSQLSSERGESCVNCPDSVTLVDAPAELVAAVTQRTDRRYYENLETYGLARVAQDHDLFFSAVLAVTNRVGPDGSVQWQRHHSEGAARVCALVRSCLTGV